MAGIGGQKPGIYAKFKLSLRRMGVSLRDFERAVTRQSEIKKARMVEFDVIKGGPIDIPGLDLHGAVEPDGFTVSLL